MRPELEKTTGRPAEADGYLSFYRVLARIAAVGQGAAFLLLFLAVVSSPVATRLMGGLSGACAVLRLSVMLGLFALLRCWLVEIILSRDPDTAEPSAANTIGPLSPRWCRLGLFLLFLACVNAFAWGIRQPASWGMVTGHDQPQYYAYLHTWIFDRDLDFRNEYEKIPGATKELTSTSGLTPELINVAPIGTPVLWLPSYVLTHGAVIFLRWFGLDSAADGLSSPYAAGVAFGNLVLVWLGMLMVYEAVRKMYSSRSALFTVVLLWLCTPLIWYLLDEAWMSHGCSFFAGSLVLYIWAKAPARRPGASWALLGASIGLAMLVRPSEVVLCSLLVVDAVVLARMERRCFFSLRFLPLALACMLGMFSLQLITWYLKSGLESPSGSPMQWGHPAIASFLFSSRHGLFSWHPVIWFGFLGIPLVWKRSRHAAVAIALILGLSVYVNASIESWWGGTSFGARRFVSVMPFMAPAIAAIGVWAIRAFVRRPWIPASVLALAFVLYNQMLIFQFREHWFNPGDAVNFQQVWATSTMMLHARFGNPLSYPANLWFAHKNDVGPGQYDILAGARPSELSIDATPPGIQTFLGKGWELPQRSWYLPNSYVKAQQRDCTLALPLERGKKYQLTIQLAPPPNLAPPQVVSFFLAEKKLGQVTLDSAKSVEFTLPEDGVKQGINTLTLSFAQVKALPFGQRVGLFGNGLEVRTGLPQQCAGFLMRLVIRRQG